MATSLERAAYIAGWHCTMSGADPRYSNPYSRRSAEAYAWDHGALDAMEAAADEKPEPACAGY